MRIRSIGKRIIPVFFFQTFKSLIGYVIYVYLMSSFMDMGAATCKCPVILEYRWLKTPFMQDLSLELYRFIPYDFCAMASLCS